jgi:hypothetical protein
MSDADTHDDEFLPIEEDTETEKLTPAAGRSAGQKDGGAAAGPKEEADRPTTAEELRADGEAPVVTRGMPEPVEAVREAEVRTTQNAEVERRTEPKVTEDGRMAALHSRVEQAERAIGRIQSQMKHGRATN